MCLAASGVSDRHTHLEDALPCLWIEHALIEEPIMRFFLCGVKSATTRAERCRLLFSSRIPRQIDISPLEMLHRLGHLFVGVPRTRVGDEALLVERQVWLRLYQDIFYLNRRVERIVG